MAVRSFATREFTTTTKSAMSAEDRRLRSREANELRSVIASGSTYFPSQQINEHYPVNIKQPGVQVKLTVMEHRHILHHSENDAKGSQSHSTTIHRQRHLKKNSITTLKKAILTTKCLIWLHAPFHARQKRLAASLWTPCTLSKQLQRTEIWLSFLTFMSLS